MVDESCDEEIEDEWIAHNNSLLNDHFNAFLKSIENESPEDRRAAYATYLMTLKNDFCRSYIDGEISARIARFYMAAIAQEMCEQDPSPEKEKLADKFMEATEAFLHVALETGELSMESIEVLDSVQDAYNIAKSKLGVEENDITETFDENIPHIIRCVRSSQPRFVDEDTLEDMGLSNELLQSVVPSRQAPDGSTQPNEDAKLIIFPDGSCFPTTPTLMDDLFNQLVYGSEQDVNVAELVENIYSIVLDMRENLLKTQPELETNKLH